MSDLKKGLSHAQDRLRAIVNEWLKRATGNEVLQRLAWQQACMRAEIDAIATTLVNMPEISAGGYLGVLQHRLEDQANAIEKELGMRITPDGKVIELPKH